MKLLYKALFAFIIILSAICDTSPCSIKDNSSSPAPVSLTVTVTNNREEIVLGLPQPAFTISDDTGVREITSLSNEDAPLSIAILVDLSGSVKSDTRIKIKSIVDGLSQFIQKSHPSNEYFIIGFNATPTLLLDGARDASAALSTIQRLASAEWGGNTALYEACLAGIEKVAGGTYPKQVILLISDGWDNRSQYKFNDVQRLLKEKSVLLYAVNIATSWFRGSIAEWNRGGPQALDELASLTGGKMYNPKSAAKMQANLERIASELRQQYSISFLPTTDVSKGKWHPLKIKVTLPAGNSQGTQKLSERSRKGYYSL
jgi:Ca-activated chloride channel family protein